MTQQSWHSNHDKTQGLFVSWLFRECEMPNPKEMGPILLCQQQGTFFCQCSQASNFEQNIKLIFIPVPERPTLVLQIGECVWVSGTWYPFHSWELSQLLSSAAIFGWRLLLLFSPLSLKQHHCSAHPTPTPILSDLQLLPISLNFFGSCFTRTVFLLCRLSIIDNWGEGCVWLLAVWF